MLLDLVILALLFLALLLLVLVAVVAAFTLPLADALNSALRRIGLAGPSPETRSAGVETEARVVRRFVARPGESTARGKVHVNGELWDAVCDAALAPGIHQGDTVRVRYGDRLTVEVVPP